MSEEQAVNLLRLLASLATFLLPMVAARRGWLARVLKSTAGMLSNERDPVGSVQATSNGHGAVATAQNLALSLMQQRIDDLRGDLDELGVRTRGSLDRLQSQVSDHAREMRSADAELRTGMNELAVRLWKLEHPGEVEEKRRE